MVRESEVQVLRIAALKTIKKNNKASPVLSKTKSDSPEEEETYGPDPPPELLSKQQRKVKGRAKQGMAHLRSINRLRFPKFYRLSSTPPISNSTSQESSPINGKQLSPTLSRAEYMEVEPNSSSSKRDLEEGELSSDDDIPLQAKPQVCVSGESFPSVDCELEIDRIIEETQRLVEVTGCSSEKIAHKAVPEVTGHLDRDKEISEMEDIDISALRTAALQSLAKKNGREDGEVSDESPRASPQLPKQTVVFNAHSTELRDNFSSEKIKSPEKFKGLIIQVRQDSKQRDVRASDKANDRKRRHSPSTSRSRTTRSSRRSSNRKHSGTSKDVGCKSNQQSSNDRRSIGPTKVARINSPAKNNGVRGADQSSSGTDASISHADMVLGESSLSSSSESNVNVDQQNIVPSNPLLLLPPPPPPPILPGVDHSEGTMFGIQLNTQNDIPLPRPHAPRPPDLARDNYDSIGMDIDNSDNSRPSSAPGSVRYEDEAEKMRKQLLQQLQQSRDNVLNASKNATTGTPERPTREGAVARNSAATGGYESSAEESYRANKAELSMVENKMQITLRQMDVLAEKRRQLMKELSALSHRLGDYQIEYLKTLETRSSLRKTIDLYELEHIRNIRIEDDSFNDVTKDMIYTDNARLCGIEAALESSRMEQSEVSRLLETESAGAINASKSSQSLLKKQQAVSSTEKDVIAKLKHSQSVAEQNSSVVKDIAPSRARRVSSMTEEELRSLLLKNVNRSMAPQSPRESASNLECQPSPSVTSIEPPMAASVVKEEVDDEQQDEYLEDDIAREEQSTEMDVNDSGHHSRDTSCENVIPQVDDHQCPPEEDPYTQLVNVNKQTERARRIEVESGLPVRLHFHAGLTRKLNHMSEICPFEMWGTCKDHTCVYQHLNDSNLPLHTILLMVLSYAPELAGPENQHYGMREKIKKVVTMKEDNETARHFVRRLLRKLPQVAKAASVLAAEKDKAANIDDRSDFESYYDDLHISAAPGATNQD